jgi:Flp pilus assembly secretin CpaC
MAAKKILGAMAFAMALAAPAFADPFTVKIDQTVAVKLASAANSVVLGNATVADVTVHDARTLLITGKAFGTTNVMVLDRAGNTIWSTDLAVRSGTDGELTIQRGAATFTYSCLEKCRGTPTVGDDPTHFGAVMGTVTGKSQTAKGGQ